MTNRTATKAARKANLTRMKLSNKHKRRIRYSSLYGFNFHFIESTDNSVLNFMREWSERIAGRSDGFPIGEVTNVNIKRGVNNTTNEDLIK
jgi:hypothetical protein